MELGGVAPDSGPPSDSTLVDSVAVESERTALGLGPAFGGPAPRVAAVESAPMTARLGPTEAERPSVSTGVPTFLGQARPAPLAPLAPEVHAPRATPASGAHEARPSHEAISAPAPWSPPAAHAAAPYAPAAAEPRARPPAAHGATLSMSSRPSLEPQAPAPAPPPVLARQGPLAATMAMPRAPTVPTSPPLGPTPPAHMGPPATQALALAPAYGVAASRESEGAQRASVASVDRASAPAWGPELPPQPFVPAAPPPVAEEPVELPKSRGGAIALGVVAAVAVVGLGIFLALRMSKPSAHVEPDAASIFAVPDAAGAALASSTVPSAGSSAEPPGASAQPPSGSAEPPSGSAEPPSGSAEPAASGSAGPTTSASVRPPSNPGPVKPQPPPSGPGGFSPAVARAKLDAANGVLVICKRAGGPSGRGSAAVTFAPAGNVSAVTLTVPFVGTPVGACVTGQFLRVKVPAFTGGPQPMAYTFTVPK